MEKQKMLSIGSVSHGTLRPQDLIPAFLDALEDVDEEKAEELRAEVPEDAWEDDEHEYWQEDADYLIDEELFPALENYCPAYCYFGTHEGDGSDFGCWPDEYAIREAIHDKELIQVDDLSDIPEDWRGPVLSVNDHGNTSLYLPETTFREAWAIV